ncbi:glutathione S-transferase N-terminal domain-containing protein [Marinomonas fungiae]|uniref:Glutathione S-transferase, N-terminal domain n=1 Tax=Marinomonas fungiae TaxID=1137284 RepID=A0A0K6IPS2_9GAMM|nr:glutathione S-transferase N-terminal domain-containing protein [Marinomonas fungiae]CUB05115.1 Glutathione S-transferase, N-terminal domain [Marinomonas fungiae]
MKLLIKLIRNLLGGIIVLLDLITRGAKKKRSPEQQKVVNEQVKDLTLYHFTACPFCTKTRRAMYKLNLPIEKRSASQGSPYRQELEVGGGRVKVPCLRIEKDGQVEWMYESNDIIRYLEQRFA